MKAKRKCLHYFTTELVLNLISNTNTIINNYQTFVNGNKFKMLKKLYSYYIQRNYFTISKIFIAKYAIPAPIKGPTATPLNRETANMVPNTSAVVTCGSSDNRCIPPFANKATTIPDKRAIQANGDLNEAVNSLKPISPLAIGANTAMVITVTPQLIPFDCKKEKNLESTPINFSTNKNNTETIND